MQILERVKHTCIIAFVSTLLTTGIVFLFQDTIGFEMEKLLITESSIFPKKGEDIVIVRVDEKSLASLQKQDLRIFSLQKSLFADFIDTLESDRVGAIGFDIIFANESTESDKKRFIETLRKYNNIVLGTKVGVAPDYINQVLPLSVFSGTTQGAIDLFLTKDVITHVSPLLTFSGNTYDSLSVATYKKWKNIAFTGSYRGDDYILDPLSKIHVNENGKMRIPFFHRPEEYPYISLVDVLEKRFPKGFFEGKVVLVGEYGTLIHDENISPIDRSKRMPGVEFHANIIDGIISHVTLKDISNKYETIIAFFSGIILIMIVSLLPTSVSICLFFLSLISIWIVGQYLYFNQFIYIHIFLFIIGAITIFVVTYIYRYAIVNKNRRYLKDSFSRYLSPELVKEIADHPERVKLGGEKRELAIFFSDIVGFTTISEKLNTENLARVINEYLSIMTTILTTQGGTLDKYIGDAVMGFYGAPVKLKDIEKRACETALLQQEALKIFNEKGEFDRIPPFAIRIGIACGEVIVGNFGSTERFDYTVFGDTVNLASRLESINKSYGTNICISDDVYEKVKYLYFCRELDTVRVKGKGNAVKIYELICRENEAGEKTHYIEYEKALEFYYQGKYKEAIKILSQNLDDAPSEMLMDRCQKALNGEIKIENGIYEMYVK